MKIVTAVHTYIQYTSTLLIYIRFIFADFAKITALKLLPLLLQSPLIKTKKDHWKPSKLELICGFILFIDVRLYYVIGINVTSQCFYFRMLKT